MEENLFIQAMDQQEVESINQIKLNKAFALRLISDLSNVFQTNHSVEDDKNFVKIRMKTSPSYNFYNCCYFIANEKGISFTSPILTYEHKIGHLFKKYENVSSKERPNDNHCVFTIKINIQRDDLNISDKLKDIVELMNLKGYYKKF
jgi:hypothetical protein